MFESLLPQPIDNAYRGSRFALWLFGLVVGVRILQSLSVIVNGYGTAISADGIPLDTFTPEAAGTAVALFAQGSLWRLTLCTIGVLVLVRYRSAVPFMFALLALNYLAAQVIYRFLPLARTGTPPGPIVNFVLFVLTVLGFALSLRRKRIHA